MGRDVRGLTPDAMERLCGYDWPGNVRELQNVVERAAILATNPVIDLPPDLVPLQTASGSVAPTSPTAQTLEDLEREHILRVVRQTRWTIEGQKGAASILGLHPNTLRSRMKKLGIVRERHEMS
jgi:DNA-binding NtrC family response regulator